MKKLLALLLIASVISCKKTTTTPANNTPANSYAVYKSGVFTINVQSNYKYPYVAIEQGQTEVVRINNGASSYTTLAPLTYSKKLATPGVYRIYVHASEGTSGTKYKYDALKTWHKVQVFLNDTIPLKVTYSDDIQTSFYFNIK
jgi:hypothetical protein